MEKQQQKQTAPAVLMIRPMRFESNPLTAESNAFQQQTRDPDPKRVQADAQAEFDGLVAALRKAGIEVVVFDDTNEPHTPDAVFPNNWLSTHTDGTAVMYPMMATNRRPERRPDLVESLSRDHGFRVEQVIDFGPRAAEERFLEGTGSMVLDRVNRVAYACLSPRTDPELLAEFGQRLDYEVIAFDGFDKGGIPIYHTNVMMCIGSGFVVICADSIGADRRDAVLEKLRAGGLEIVEISLDQMLSFAGNMLELENADGDAILAMSAQALASLDASQVERLAAHAKIVSAPIDTIETSAGGSVRCMLAEIHLPRKAETLSDD